MSVDIPVRKIALDKATDNPIAKGFILDFIVVDAFTIHTMLLTDKDPTMVSTKYINIASEDFYRDGLVDESTGAVVDDSMEDFGAFAGRTYKEAVQWALVEIVSFNEAKQLVAALAAILPEAMDR